MNKKVIKLVLIIILGILILGGGVIVGIKIQKEFDNKNPLIKKTQEIVDEESVVTKVVEKATGSVVTVSINKNISNIFNLSQQNIEQDVGTGFIISSDGLIVTNKHVVSDTSAKYKVVIGKDEVVEVVNIYRDPINDLAILKVDKTALAPVEMGDSDRLKVGQTVIAIGTALGEFRSTVTKGVISGLDRGITAGGVGVESERLEDVIQVDAAINSGNSGGPLFDSSGKVIGVNVAVSQNGQSIGFALPINLVKVSVDNFRNTGEFDRPYLGVAYKTISKKEAEVNNIPIGNYIQLVAEGSPAEKAGIKTGDIVIEIDGEKISEGGEISIAKAISKKKIGDEIKIKYVRDKKEIEVIIFLEKKE
ncbi:MAG: trypsin-like peptidase domain-containing protein [Candidatus Shapirobacteria bacterium]